MNLEYPELLENGAICKSDFGLRINPIVGGGDIAAMSTATKVRKMQKNNHINLSIHLL